MTGRFVKHLKTNRKKALFLPLFFYPYLYPFIIHKKLGTQVLTNDIDEVVAVIKDTKERIDSLLYVQSLMDQKPFSRDDFRLGRLKALSEYLDTELSRLQA